MATLITAEWHRHSYRYCVFLDQNAVLKLLTITYIYNYTLFHDTWHTQTHSEVQGKLALQHSHLLLLQLVLQPHRTNSWQNIAASGSVHRIGRHVSSLNVQSHSFGCDTLVPLLDKVVDYRACLRDSGNQYRLWKTMDNLFGTGVEFRLFLS